MKIYSFRRFTGVGTLIIKLCIRFVTACAGVLTVSLRRFVDDFLKILQIVSYALALTHRMWN